MNEALFFEADLNFFFETLFKQAERGKIPLQRVNDFFPPEVKERCKEEENDSGD